MSRKSVLVVDDHPVNRRLVELLLTGSEFEVSKAESGEEALRAVRTHSFDIVLLDIEMPGMRGDQALVRIREEHGVNAPYMIAYTAYAPEDQRRLLRAAGFDAVLAKPVTRQALADVLSAINGAPDV